MSYRSRGPARRSSARGRLLAVLVSAAVPLAAVSAAVGILPRPAAQNSRADEVTASQDNLRTGWDPSEPGLSPAVVAGGRFGQLFSTAVSGQVYAQPVVAGSTVIVATEKDMVYGLNAASGAITWSQSLGQPLPAATIGCADISPDVGVTSAPVYDPATGTVYLVAVVNDGPSADQPHVYMFALDAQTGAVRWRVAISGAPVNDPTRPFNPLTERQRAGLLLLNGWVYVAFASYCDFAPYDGYVAGVSTATRALTMWTDEAGLTDSQGGIWQGGGGLMSDGPGRIFVATGNGVSPAPGPGGSPPSELGDAAVRLSVAADGTLSAGDFFSPANAPTLDARDTDFGSGGPTGLPFGSGADPDLLVQAGKDGRVFLLNRAALGGRAQGTGGTDAPVSMAGPFQGQWGHPAAFGDTATVTPGNAGGSSDYVYYVGRRDDMRFLKLGLDASGTPVLADVANSTAAFGFTSGSPVVTSNGTSPATAVVWEVFAGDAAGVSGRLEAFDAVPGSACTSAAPCGMSPIWSAPIGTASKFTIPATDSGRVYVGTRDGIVLAFGSPDAAPLRGVPVDFGNVRVAGPTPGKATVTITATSDVTVSAITPSSSATADPFAVGAPILLNGSPAALPVTMSPGDALTVPVTFSPTVPGGVTGSLALATNSANFPAVSVSLTGNGTRNGFYATPGSADFGTVPDGTSLPANLTITNGGSSAETVLRTRPPLAPFAVTGLPARGRVIAPGASVTATVTYRPTAARADGSSFTITGRTAAGAVTRTTVRLSGTGAADLSELAPSPAAVSFGSVPLGQQATQTVDISNAGNLTATITGSAPPTVPFGAPDPVAAGLQVDPGSDLEVPVTFTPASAGPVASTDQVSWKDAAGRHSVTIPVTGTGTAPASGIAVPPPGGGWTLNGSARMSGTSLVLTPAAQHKAGSAVYSVPQPSSGLAATFTARIGGGDGADGMTLSLLDAGRSGPRSIGHAGGELGFGGLHGVAVTLDTVRQAGHRSSNFIGISTGARGGQLTFAASSARIPALRRGQHTIGVQVSGGAIIVTVDGTQRLDAKVALPPSVLVAFTASTGRRTDVHTVTSAVISSGSGPLPPPGGGWSFNGSAGMSGADAVLTGAVMNQAGSAAYPVPVRTAGLSVVFDTQLSGGTGGAGLTFALLDPAKATAGALGGGGAKLGFGGLSGVAVALVTQRGGGYPLGNLVGLSTGTIGGRLGLQTLARAIPPLRRGTHIVSISVTAGGGGPDILVVRLDGEQILQRAEPSLTATSVLAFTGGTGSLTDVHTIRDAAISAAP